jgi:hypothetical protein
MSFLHTIESGKSAPSHAGNAPFQLFLRTNGRLFAPQCQRDDYNYI